MSDDDKDDLEYVEEYPVLDRVTSKFEWHKVPSEPSQKKYRPTALRSKAAWASLQAGFASRTPGITNAFF
ncbi:MAG: hypothetical protein ABJ007_03240 [Pseudophaeobacter sp.]|uniref:hypothetical protein n=1 Tax=Pseudophaeobacter sp. TaxID=1971739 RepID=UPI0032983769